MGHAPSKRGGPVSQVQTTGSLTLRCVGCNGVVYAAAMGESPKRDADRYFNAATAMVRRPGKYVQKLEPADWTPDVWGCKCLTERKLEQGSLL